MATISRIATHDAQSYGGMGLRRAVIAGHAVLGDCVTVRDHARAVLSLGHWKRPGCVVPLGRQRRGASAADLALSVSRRLMEHRPVPPGSVGAVIYCHEAPDVRLSESTPGRLQHELELHAATPFAISQAHATSLFIALDLALGLLHGPEAAEHVLLAASDKLLFGGPAGDAHRLMFGDVAAAALMSRDPGPGWRLEHVVVRQFATPADALAPWPRTSVAGFASFGADVVREALREVGLGLAPLHAVISTTPDPAFVTALHRAAGLPDRQIGRGPAARCRHAASADLLLALEALQHKVPVSGRVLAWSAGNNGEFACCMLTRH